MPEPGGAEAKEGTKKDAAATKDGSGEGEKAVLPAGVVPLFFTGAGQKIFECVVDQDVTPGAPNKLIPKTKIIEDFRNRAAVSDFHPVKKKVQVSLYSI